MKTKANKVVSVDIWESESGWYVATKDSNGDIITEWSFGDDENAARSRKLHLLKKHGLN